MACGLADQTVTRLAWTPIARRTCAAFDAGPEPHCQHAEAAGVLVISDYF